MFLHLGARGRRIIDINCTKEHVDKHPNVVLPAREVHTICNITAGWQLFCGGQNRIKIRDPDFGRGKIVRYFLIREFPEF